MKNSILFRFAFAVAFLCLITISAEAQDYVGAYGYTSIDYNEVTDTVTAFSETDMDYDLSGYYSTYVQLVVTKSNGTVVASGSAQDNSGLGYAGVVLNFSGEANTTYTAIGRHIANATLYDYYDYAPYQEFYHDSYYLSYFMGENLYEPWFHFFESPGYRQATIQVQRIKLGKTYDSLTTTLSGDDILFKTVSNDVNSNIGNFNSDFSIQKANVNLSGASHPVCGTNRTAFNITVNFDLPPDAVSLFHPDARTFISDSDKQQFQFLSIAFEDVSYTLHKGKMIINVRQVRPDATDNGFRIRITGGLQGGGSYIGNARVNFSCS